MDYSVVMATYNGARFIEKQLDSINKQTLMPKEIIIIDDCSSDNTVDLIEKFSQKSHVEIKVCRHHENKGYQNAFYEGMELASCEIVFLADQDDIWKKDKAEKIVYVFSIIPKMLAVNTNYELIDEKGQIIKEKKFFSRRKSVILQKIKEVNVRHILGYNISMGCTMAFRKKLIKKIKENRNFVSDLKIPHDWLINYMAAEMHGLYYLNVSLIYYRLHSNNTLGLKRAANIEDRILGYRNMIIQKRELKQINEFIFDNQKTRKILNGMLHAYESMMEALDKRSLYRYVQCILKNKVLRYFSIKTILYDIVLIFKSNVKGFL
ncbi:MAG: glycosyltransferase family 2 protein [Roseburia sp.]|nr:glycosyltransferase family 2 protein [Roseburia sp.]